MEPYFSWQDPQGTVHGAESGNLAFALCGMPLEALVSELKISRWKAESAPANLCEECRQKVNERSANQFADDDTGSDPARSDTVGHDWTGEGGATAGGPATDIDSGRPDN